MIKHLIHIVKGINKEKDDCSCCVQEVEGALFWTRWLRIKHWFKGDWQR